VRLCRLAKFLDDIYRPSEMALAVMLIAALRSNRWAEFVAGLKVGEEMKSGKSSTAEMPHW